MDPITVIDQEIHANIQVSRTSKPWLLSLVYAITLLVNRKILWNNLEIVVKNNTRPWLLCGDFNEVIVASEKFGGRPINSKRSATFLKCLDTTNMIDVAFMGPRFTWTNKRTKKDNKFWKD